MNGLPMEQHIAARKIETEIGARTAREFLARSLAWEHRLQCLRQAAAGTPVTAAESSVEAA